MPIIRMTLPRGSIGTPVEVTERLRSAGFVFDQKRYSARLRHPVDVAISPTGEMTIAQEVNDEEWLAANPECWIE